MKRYGCSKCGKFLAEIRGHNDVDIKGKITIKDNKFIVKCLNCGQVTEIKIKGHKETKK